MHCLQSDLEIWRNQIWYGFLETDDANIVDGRVSQKPEAIESARSKIAARSKDSKGGRTTRRKKDLSSFGQASIPPRSRTNVRTHQEEAVETCSRTGRRFFVFWQHHRLSSPLSPSSRQVRVLGRHCRQVQCYRFLSNPCIKTNWVDSRSHLVVVYFESSIRSLITAKLVIA